MSAPGRRVGTPLVVPPQGQAAAAPALRMLVSVRSVDEALLVARSGADFVDLKEPSAGALGGLPTATIRAIVAALSEGGFTQPVSATIGDLGLDDVAPVLARAAEVAACGVDYVKVGIPRQAGAFAVLDALSRCPFQVVPVFIADHGLDAGAVQHAGALGFPALMVDTADKQAGSLFDRLSTGALHGFVAHVRESGAMAGLAGALRLHHVPALAALAPDFAGFRTAVCVGDRRAVLDADCLKALVARLREASIPGGRSNARAALTRSPHPPAPAAPEAR